MTTANERTTERYDMPQLLEWRRMPRSIRFENETHALDVWKVHEDGRLQYRFTAFDRIDKTYIGGGLRPSEDEACEAAMKAAKL